MSTSPNLRVTEIKAFCFTVLFLSLAGLTVSARAQEEEKSPAEETSSGGLSSSSAKPSATPASTSSAPSSPKTDSASTAAASGYPRDKPAFTAVAPKGWMVMYGSDNALQFWSDDSVVEVDLFKLLGATDDASSKQRLTDVAKGIADMSMGGNAKNTVPVAEAPTKIAGTKTYRTSFTGNGSALDAFSFSFDGKEFFIVSAHGPEAALKKNAADIASILASIKAAK
jgi:hypothetical protein